MAYDEGLAQRIRDHLDRGHDPWEAKQMFGGLCFLVGGHMAFGVLGDEIMVRLGKENWADAIARPHARAMDFTGRSMKGLVYVGAAGLDADADLEDWLERGLAHARSLPPKR